jgi:hypothetical protein
MHLILTDETNRQPSPKVKFFVYGGLIFPIEALYDLDRRIQGIREWAGYRPGDEFKFDTHSRPEQVSFDVATEAKRQVIAACQEIGCRFIAHIILHQIIANQDPKQQVQWAADYVISRFNMYLEELEDIGICVIDNLPEPGQFSYLSEKYQFGLRGLPGGDRSLNQIQLYAATCSGASNVSSAMDIVLGTFRYCINDPPNQDAAIEMLKSLVPMIWYRETKGKRVYEDYGIILRPKRSKVKSAFPKFYPEYDKLIKHLNMLAGGG